MVMFTVSLMCPRHLSFKTLSLSVISGTLSLGDFVNLNYCNFEKELQNLVVSL